MLNEADTAGFDGKQLFKLCTYYAKYYSKYKTSDPICLRSLESLSQMTFFMFSPLVPPKKTIEISKQKNTQMICNT